jgi:sugar/nucleoside kinase (ribokinase family)
MEPVVVLGDALVDMVYRVEALPPVGGDAAIRERVRRPGGAGLNVAVGLAGVGVPCSLLAVVGDDEEGAWLARHLEEHGVDTSLLARRGTSGYVVCFADAQGERTMFSFRGACAEPVELDGGGERARALSATLARTPLLFVSGYGLQERAQGESWVECARRAKAAGALVALDPAPVVGRADPWTLEPLLELVDVLLPNEAELQAFAAGWSAPPGGERPLSLEAAVQEVRRRIPYLGVKLGRRGALVAAANWAGVVECPAQPVEAAETTGAGDAFDAGFLAALLRGLPPEGWGAEGNRLAARVVSKLGVAPFPMV